MLLFYITCKDFEEASNIAQKLVEEKLIASANVYPNISSYYYWKGAMHQSNECTIFAKTIEAKEKQVEKRVKELHSYEIPCIISFKTESINKEYEKWAKETLAIK